VLPGSLGPDKRTVAIGQIGRVPSDLRAAVADLSPEQLDTPYRSGGWTVRQVVHHLPDSHLNAYTRFKLALTEDVPTIRTYDEAAWAELPDATGHVEPSLQLMDALHDRWVYLLEGLDDTAWKRSLQHPEVGELGMDDLLALYAWHGRHHVAHITTLRESRGW
jgi:uncharacterized damage-inducible protein DinB